MKRNILCLLLFILITGTAFAGPDNITDQTSSSVIVNLYFRDLLKSNLSAIPCSLENKEDMAAFARNIIELLFKGPGNKAVSAIPDGTHLLALYVDSSGTAYVDMSREIKDGQPGGILAESISVYSIVNSLALNVTGVRRVKLLIEGREEETLAGHIDIRFPLEANMLLIR